jgi:hypothetical protein
MKLEAGKTYRLVDKVGYSKASTHNSRLVETYFKDDVVTIFKVDGSGDGFVNGCCLAVITSLETKYFELVEGTDLTKLDKPFGELDDKTKKALLCAWVDGAGIVTYWDGSDKVFHPISNPNWSPQNTYRVKPAISEEDATKAKLITEAQQKLKEAQEALDKLQGL